MLADYLYENAAKTPDDTAVVYRDERITHAELLDRVERVAAGLKGRGLGAGDPVGLVLPDGPWFLVAFHAIAAIGAVVVPANPAFKQAELDFIFRSSGIKAVISDERSAGVCAGIVASFEDPVEVIGSGEAHGQSVSLDDLFAQGEPERLPARAPDETLVCQFSSGSTGRPKRLERTHGQCIAESESYRAMGIGPADRIMVVVPLFHTWGMGACTFTGAITGATLVFLDEPHPFLLRRHRALELIEEERVTILPGVPFNYRLMAESPREADLSSLRLCFTAGMGMAREVFDAFFERFGVPVRQLYGSTETGMIAANLSDDPDATFESVGRPVLGVLVDIVDEDAESLPTGKEGEVVVSGPAVTEGYSDLPELTAVAFRGGRYHTGDLGRLDEEGNVYITGRKKLLIETGGFKVDPIEVEAVIDSHPAVAESIVVGVPTGVAGEFSVKAVVVASGETDEREVIAFCRERLANYKVPQRVEFRDEIPKSPLGKVQRKYLV
jgi:long-chain acyl-CoA synthetase